MELLKKSSFLMLIASLIIIGISFIGSKGELVENIELPIGVGTDIDMSSGEPEYDIPLLVSSSNDSEKSTYIIQGKAGSLAETRERRQLKSGKKFMLGLTKLYVYSEDTAKFGLKNFVEINFNNPEANDRAINVIVNGNTKDLLEFKTKGYPSSPEFIEEMIRNLGQFNFFPMQYTTTDLIVRIEAEGRNLLLPYIELTDDEIKTTGLAIFKGPKMVGKADIEEARVINILKEDKVRGVLTLQEDSKKYINFYAKSKRKVKCYKEDDKYKFVINLNITGAVVTNELYEDLKSDTKVLKKFEEDMKEYVEKNCNDQINKIMKKYKVDVLDLGRVAAAKYGRGTGVDWNEIVSNSEIIVNAKVKVDSQGRGDY
ncbi:MAG: Ger(x)C family spore germination protein [Clostridiaceae bacterium]